MGTSATIKVVVGTNELRLRQHYDGYPDFVRPAIAAALEECAGVEEDALLDWFHDCYRDAVSTAYQGRDANLTRISEQESKDWSFDYRYVVCPQKGVVVGSDDLV